MAAAVDAQDSPPQGMFVVGSGVDVSSVKEHLQHLVSLPVSAPDEPELALARGAALAAASAPALESSTVGLAYSQDPDGTTAGSVLAGLANAETQLRPVGADGASLGDYDPQTDLQLAEGERKPFLLVGSALTSIFVVGVVALVISLAVSIRPTADQRPSPGQNALVPTTVAPAAPAPAPAPEAQPIEAPPPATGADHQAAGARGPGGSAGTAADRVRRGSATGGGPASCGSAARPRGTGSRARPGPGRTYRRPSTTRRRSTGPWTPPWRPTYLPQKPWKPPVESAVGRRRTRDAAVPATAAGPAASRRYPQVPQVPQQQYPQSPSLNGSGNGSNSRRGSQISGLCGPLRTGSSAAAAAEVAEAIAS